MEINELLGHFEGVAEDHDGMLMHCPSHSDSQTSLKLIVHENGKVGIVCRAGCPSADVVKASGLPWSAFFNVTGASNVAPSAAPSPVTGPPVTRLAVYVDASRERYAGSAAETYAADRFGITPDLAERLELGYDEGTGFAHTHGAYTRYPRLVVPFPDHTGRPHALQGRDITGECEGRWVGLTNPDGMAWGRYAFFNVSGGTAPVIVSEGPGDALSAVGAGLDALAIRGAALATAEGLVEALTDRTVLVAGDNDTAGQKFNAKVAEILAPHGVSVLPLPIPERLGNKADLTDWRKEDPAAFPDVLAEAVREAMTPKEVAGVAIETVEKETGVKAVTQDQGRAARRLIGELSDTYGRTDRGEGSDATNAYALVAWSQGSIKYAPGLGFYVWNGQVWEKSGERVRNQVHAMGAALMLAGATVEARGFTFTNRIEALLTELRSVPTVYANADDFDASPHLLSFRNGTVDLRNGAIRPHQREDLITAMVDVFYDPNAKAPLWESFLSEIMPGMPEMPGYLQRLIGYGITGLATEQCFAVLHGKGANGKSVLCETLKGTFRSVTKTTRVATFEEKASGSIPNDVAALREARLVLASEGDANKPMSETVIKNATGDEEMTARFLRQEEFSFLPKFLLLLATNHKPQFKGQDEGLWRRVKLIPFKRYFTPEERDHQMKSKLLAEASGIAAWAVRGAVEWHKHGLQDPEVIRDATKDYRESSNPLDEFCPGMYEITRDDADKVAGATLYLDYKDWCEASGLQRGDIWKRPTLYRAIEDLGASKVKEKPGIVLYGIRKTEPDPVKDGPGIFAG